ncbi:MAG: Nramp family divalent metal transporter [Planctomycetes bacterium]|nr:Nramp family divalent metal transporter [Planctomycetota bacterium]
MADTAPESASVERVPAGCMPPWEVGELPAPPDLRWSLRAMLGPGLLMTGAAIGGGEWLIGPAMTAQYGGTLMWIALISIILQACYNLEVMRYTLYCGEPILTGCFRIVPGPLFWTFVYLALDFGAIWPYLSANAAVPLTSAFLGHIPGAAVDLAGRAISEAVQQHELAIKQWVSYGIYVSVFIPLIFGGKVYNALEKVMVAKIVLVLGYLTFLGLFYVGPATWYRIFSGFVGSPGVRDGSISFQWAPTLVAGQKLDWALLATFAAIAGAGGLSNTAFSAYCRDKGWGMGPLVGALPSAVGGHNIELSHVGMAFRIHETSLGRWRGWLRVIQRDQWAIWVIGCIFGMAIPSLVSMEFIPDLGRKVTGDELAAVAAKLISDRTGHRIFWWLTLFCGFLVLSHSQVSTIDGIFRRWTDIIWTGIPAVQKLGGNQVKYVYYGLMAAYFVFGMAVLVLIPNPLEMVQIASVLYNFALGFSALHTLVLNCTLVPAPLRPGWLMRAGLVLAFVFFTAVSGIATRQKIVDLKAAAAKKAQAANNSLPSASSVQETIGCSFSSILLECPPFAAGSDQVLSHGWESQRDGVHGPNSRVAHVPQRCTA